MMSSNLRYTVLLASDSHLCLISSSFCDLYCNLSYEFLTLTQQSLCALTETSVGSHSQQTGILSERLEEQVSR